jgi:hypothetical protein
LSEEYKGRHNPQKAGESLMGKNVSDKHRFGTLQAKTRSSKINLVFTAPEPTSFDLADVPIGNKTTQRRKDFYGQTLL